MARKQAIVKTFLRIEFLLLEANVPGLEIVKIAGDHNGFRVSHSASST
jgi:hypothetical protein